MEDLEYPEQIQNSKQNQSAKNIPIFYDYTFINSTRCSEADQMCCHLTYEMKFSVYKHTVIYK